MSDDVTCVWSARRQVESDTPESCGVLVGTTSIDRREVWIESVTTPMAEDGRSRFSYKLRDPGHQRTVSKEFASSGGRAIYLGTWHTHPEPWPTPSRIDRRDWLRCVRLNRGRPLAFVLVGTVEIRVFIRTGLRFKLLMEECDNHG